MPSSLNLRSYVDVLDVLDRALASDRGVRVRFDTPAEAAKQRFRMNNARKLHREESKRMFLDESHPKYGTSEYDTLEFVIPKGEAYVDVRRIQAGRMNVEEL